MTRETKKLLLARNMGLRDRAYPLRMERRPCRHMIASTVIESRSILKMAGIKPRRDTPWP